MLFAAEVVALGFGGYLALTRMNKVALLLVLMFAGAVAHGAATVDFGADLRVREEMLKNVPGLPGGGRLSTASHGKFVNQFRFRPRVWGEFKFDTDRWGAWRLKTRLADEFRWYPERHNHRNTFPGEAVFDNLFLEGKGLFKGFLDFRLGRQDLYYQFPGLEHILSDGTPGDGSRTSYADMAFMSLNFTKESKLDLFALYNFDDADDFRWGTRRSKHTALTGIGGGEPEMDDWGFGAVWNSNLGPAVPYKLMFFEKNTASYHLGDEKRPGTRRDLFGFRLDPKLNEEFTMPLEFMVQLGRTSDHHDIAAWSGYGGIEWKSAARGIKPFASVTVRYMSGDKHAADEDGGRSAWDPMWCRSVEECELFLCGTHYGVGWWSNMIYEKNTVGLEFGPHHAVSTWIGPIFAAEQDHLGGGDGRFKGFLSVLRYDFPILTPDRAQGERLEIFGHVYAELFNPGDYYDSDKPAWFFRWEVVFKF